MLRAQRVGGRRVVGEDLHVARRAAAARALRRDGRRGSRRRCAAVERAQHAARVAARLGAQQVGRSRRARGSRCVSQRASSERDREEDDDAGGDDGADGGARAPASASRSATLGPVRRRESSPPLSSRKRRTEASWCSRRSAMPRACSAARCGEVLQAALGVVGQRVDVRDVLLGAGDAHRRPALGERARAAHRRDGELPLGRDERDRHQPVGGQPDVEVDASGRRATWPLGEVLERLAPDREHGVGGRRARRAARAPARRRPPRPRRGPRRRRGRGRTARAAARAAPTRARPRRGRRGRRRSGSCRGRARPWKTTVSASRERQAADPQRDGGRRPRGRCSARRSRSSASSSRSVRLLLRRPSRAHLPDPTVRRASDSGMTIARPVLRHASAG